VTLTTRTYQVELMPSGNVFSPGGRIRLYTLGTPPDQLPSLPGLGAPQILSGQPSGPGRATGIMGRWELRPRTGSFSAT
jgi:hypothetical protein